MLASLYPFPFDKKTFHLFLWGRRFQWLGHLVTFKDFLFRMVLALAAIGLATATAAQQDPRWGGGIKRSTGVIDFAVYGPVAYAVDDKSINYSKTYVGIKCHPNGARRAELSVMGSWTLEEVGVVKGNHQSLILFLKNAESTPVEAFMFGSNYGGALMYKSYDFETVKSVFEEITRLSEPTLALVGRDIIMIIPDVGSVVTPSVSQVRQEMARCFEQ
ncbi:MAG: hypothetical protein AB8B47_09935 [Roseobacter sp.]